MPFTPGGARSLGWTGSLAISTPTQYPPIQRNTSTTGAIAITGTHSGILSGGIEASFNGGAYQTIVASPIGGAYSGTLTGQTPGQGTLTVRCVDSHSTIATKANVSLGDIYVIGGDSNFVGWAQTGPAVPQSGTIIAGEWANDKTWKPQQESLVDGTGTFSDLTGNLYSIQNFNSHGSMFGYLATLIQTNKGVPVFFVPASIDGTSLSHWSLNALEQGPPYSNWVGHASSLGEASQRMIDSTGNSTFAHKALLLNLGTNDAGISQADYQAALQVTCDQWHGWSGSKVVCTLVPNQTGWTATARAATTAAIAADANCLLGPDFDGAWAATHYETDTEIMTAATRLYNALVALGFY